jgi:hypothetical protein
MMQEWREASALIERLIRFGSGEDEGDIERI